MDDRVDDVDVDVRQLAQDLRQVLFGARVVVVPGRSKAAAPSEAALEVADPPQTHERDAAVVDDVGRIEAARVALTARARGGRRCHRADRQNSQPLPHKQLLCDGTRAGARCEEAERGAGPPRATEPGYGAEPHLMKRAAFVFVFVTVLLDMLALGIIVPVLPALVLQFKAGDTAGGAIVYGLFATVWSVMQFIFSPVLGSLSDRFGRRTVILLSNFGLGLDYVLMAVAPSLGWLFVGRLISGITAASIPAATAYIADVTPPENRAGAFGILGAAFGLGFVVGPA